MEQHTIIAMEQLFETLVRHEFDFSDTITLGVRTTDDWEYPLPNGLLEHEFMTLVIKGWSLENSYPTGDGLYITAVFGEQENSKTFIWEDIKGIFTDDGVPLIVKPYDPIKDEEVVIPELSLKDVMHDSEGVKKSMKIMRKLNPKKGNK